MSRKESAPRCKSRHQAHNTTSKASSATFTPLQDQPGFYRPAPLVSADDILNQAREILATRCAAERRLESPRVTCEHFMHQLADYDHEVFGAIFLDKHHRVLTFEILFHGTFAMNTQYPRQIAKRALAHNATAIILAHNRLAKDIEPSRLDEVLTVSLKQTLTLVDVRLLDHIIVGAGETFSFRERGLL